MRYLLLYPELTYEIFDGAGALLLASLRVPSSPLWITVLSLTTLQAPVNDSNDRQQPDYANGQPPNALLQEGLPLSPLIDPEGLFGVDPEHRGQR
jgi:hypothetical protein